VAVVYPLKPEEEFQVAMDKLAEQPTNIQYAVGEFTTMATMNIPEDQRELVKARLINAIIAALPVAMKELKFSIEQIIRPTKMVSGAFTIVELRPEMFNLTTFRHNWTSTGEQDCPWNVRVPDNLIPIIIGLQNPEPSPKTRYIYGKIGVDDLPVYYVGDLSGLRVKLLPESYILKPRADISLKVYVEATGYDELRPFGAAIVRADDATKLKPWTFTT